MNAQKSGFLLALTAFIWGTAFVAQSVGMDYVGPFTFNSVRSFIGALTLLPCIAFLKHFHGNIRGSISGNRKTLLLGGICCGLALAVGSSLQQIGIQYTSVGKAGFITALYIVIVPLLGIFLKKRIGASVWLAVVLAVGGMYLLCMTEQFGFTKGDVYILVGLLAFSFHILIIDYFSPRVDGVCMSCIQFFVCGCICAVPMLLLEQPSLSIVCAAWAPILYAGVLSCGVAYTLQVIGQKHCPPTVAALLLSLESVFSALAGWVVLHQALSLREIIGCVLVFAAILLAQLPPEWFCRGKKNITYFTAHNKDMQNSENDAWKNI